MTFADTFPVKRSRGSASGRRRPSTSPARAGHRLLRILLGALVGPEEVRAVLDDRPAERAALLDTAGTAALLTLLSFSVIVFALRSLSRRLVKKLPRIWFVPLLVTMFMTPPLLRPYSAL